MVCYGAQFVTKRPEAGRRFIKAYLQGVRDYNDALKDGRIAGPDAEDVVDAIARYSVTKDRDLIRSVILRRTPRRWAWSKATSWLRTSWRSRKRPRLNLDPTRGDPAEVPQYQILWFR